jgi:uncharacterized cupin superfamily protein
MPKFQVNLDLNQRELIRAAIHNSPSAPGTGVLGQIYFNSVSNKLFICTNPTGPVWSELVTTATAGLAFGNITDGTNTAAADGPSDTFTITSANNRLTAAVNEAVDSLLLTLNEANIDHGNLAGLGDDDHTQYLAHAGRSGGQTVYGGTAASNNLVLRSTSHATKGNITLGAGTYAVNVDEATGTVMMGGSGTLHLTFTPSNINTANPALRIADDETFSTKFSVSGQGAVVAASTVTSTRFISTQATGTAPFSVTSTTVVTNLNADLLDGQSGGFYVSRANHSGTQLASTISNFDTQVRTSRLDQMAIPTASVSLNSQRITNLGTPTADTDAATKAYVDAVKQALDIKDSVRVATTANITLNGTQTIDGVAVIANDRVLVKDQTTGSENGIYVCTAGAWTRATDADSSAELTGGTYVFVNEGTSNADSGWVLTTNDTITLNTTALVFTQFSGAGQITAGTGLTKSGNTISASTALQAVHSLVNTGATGLLSITGSNTIASRTLTAGTGITVTNGDGVAGSPTVAINSAWTGQTSITTLGTIGTGLWNATPIAVNKGGTNLTSYTTGDLIYASGSTTLNKLAAVATGNALISGGTGTAPSWGKIDLTAHISGTLPIANGGTGGADASTARTNLSSTSSPLPQKYVTNFGNGSATSFTITHNLGTRAVAVTIMNNSTYEVEEFDVTASTTNTITINAAVAPASNAYQVTVIG